MNLRPWDLLEKEWVCRNFSFVKVAIQQRNVIIITCVVCMLIKVETI